MRRMPAEWAAHERTLMAWPCRRELWGGALAQARVDYAATANAIAAFEPLTMVCQTEEDAAAARAALTADAEIVVLPIDDSWLRDNGPIFVLDDDGRRAAVHFGFNAWGGKFPPWDRDAAVGATLAERLGDPCLLNPNRNPGMAREEIERHLGDLLGAERVVWLEQGLIEDRDTDGHVDLIAAFIAPGEVLLQSAPPDNPNHERLARNHETAQGAGLRVTEFPLLPYAHVQGERVVVSHMNFYLCNGAVVVPLAGAPADAEALERIAAAYPGREAVGVPGGTIAYGGGGPHCITQQVPAAS